MQSCHSLLQNATFHSLLLECDRELAALTRGEGDCGHCRSGSLDQAHYPRKPRGVGVDADEKDHRRRFSYCCNAEGCRRRMTPPSIRFLGRRVYLGVIVILVTALRQGPSARGWSDLAKEWNIDERTLSRWGRWWREAFPETRFWKEAKGRFATAVEEAELPWSLAQCFAKLDSPLALFELLLFLSPLSSPGILLADFSQTMRDVLHTQSKSWRSLEDPS